MTTHPTNLAGAAPMVGPLAPVTLMLNAGPYDDRGLRGGQVVVRVDVLGEPTAVDELWVIPKVHLDQDDQLRLSDGCLLVHAPTSMVLMGSNNTDLLRRVAGALAGLDWAFTDPAEFTGERLLRATAAVGGCQMTQPTSTELPAHDAWGRGGHGNGRGQGLKRSARGMARDLLEDFQLCWNATIGDDGTVAARVDDPDRPGKQKANPAWDAMMLRWVHDFGLVYLLLALHRTAPQVGDSAAAALADWWDAGDACGEWAYSWHQALAAGEPPLLYGVPDPALLEGGLLDAGGSGS